MKKTRILNFSTRRFAVSPTEGNEYSTRVREEDISLTALMQHPAASGSSASCPSSLQMWHPHEEQGSNGSVLGQNLDETAIGFEWQKFFNNGGRVWDIFQDNETLRRHYAVRKNIVLDSIYPQSTPHIVLTPAEETWDDQLVAWENRVESQWMGNLMVPIVSALWLPPPIAPSLEPTIYIDYDPSLEGNVLNPIGVFSISKFNKFIESASTERLVLCQLVRALQKQQCRAVFFRASTIAQSFRERYNSSLDCLKSFELPFVWSDPAEPILATCSKLLGTTIIDSPCPFLLPHIIICTPPPQDFWIPWNNATNDPQDQSFGNYLIVPSVAVGVINPAEVSSWESASCANFDIAVDQSESPPTPSSSLPDTPVDERDDLDYFLTRHGDVGDAGMETDYYHQSLRGLPPIQEEYLEVESAKLPLRPIFSIEEDEDDLPPLDDWYK
ncbi:hypothetical protein BDZ94DRAFT_1255445 [Collybia nuda]|uniref:Uncharacterized protein n=1 Tax=Collybia nuda TaxID=64659 RepID=A0A9P6CG56_9AGAR|nr:hypothetical protein BDZ94DRAFT_1255445 [Collybia nuda]